MQLLENFKSKIYFTFVSSIFLMETQTEKMSWNHFTDVRNFCEYDTH